VTGDGAGRAADWFRDTYRADPDGVWHAPGRANLIGEHTDYNDGFVLPFALAMGVRAAAARRDDGVLELCSRQVPPQPAADPGTAPAGPSTAGPSPAGPGSAAGKQQRLAFPLDSLTPGSVRGWAAYGAGVAWSLRQAGHQVGGARVAIDADLPQGAGLSSSAALECAVALALTELYRIDVPRPELARLAQRAENEFAGVPSGIMDQSASLLCREGDALLLDCRTLKTSQVPFDLAGSGFELLIIDTRASHELTGGEYADRRRACERAAELLGVKALRDVTDVNAALESLEDPVLLRRARHVLTENHRVQAAVGLLRAGAIGEVGALLNASHLSLRDDFEVSWPEADATVAAAVASGATGARMIGGGFGGSVIALTPAGRSPGVAEALAAEYARRSWTAPRIHPAQPEAGAHRLA
jgi:galactokinase